MTTHKHPQHHGFGKTKECSFSCSLCVHSFLLNPFGTWFLISYIIFCLCPLPGGIFLRKSSANAQSPPAMMLGQKKIRVTITAPFRKAARIFSHFDGQIIISVRWYVDTWHLSLSLYTCIRISNTYVTHTYIYI